MNIHGKNEKDPAYRFLAAHTVLVTHKYKDASDNQPPKISYQKLSGGSNTFLLIFDCIIKLFMLINTILTKINKLNSRSLYVSIHV